MNIQVIKKQLLSENWFKLYNYTYDITPTMGNVLRHKREVYDRGNGATILLYNREKNSVVLIRQFRIATWVNGNQDGLLIEACAGLLDDASPEACIRKEAVEETGYAVDNVQKLWAVYMSPGGVTELIHFFAAEYHPDSKQSEGGGVADEGEAIEVLELLYPVAMKMVARGEICDGKTIMLLQHAQIAGWLTA